MDECERGKAAEEDFLKDAIRRQREQEDDGFSTDCCIDCGKAIPEERRKAMAKLGMTCNRCVACKEHLERSVRGDR